MTKDDGDKTGKKKSLAEQLSRLDLDLPEEDSAPSSKGEEKSQKRQKAPKREEPPQPEEPREPEMSPDELFRHAVENLDAADIYPAKYEGKAAAPLPPAKEDDIGPRFGDADSDEEGRRRVEEIREITYFEQSVGPVVPVKDRGKYQPPRRTNLPDPDKESSKEEPKDTLLTPSLPREGKGLQFVPPLDRRQRELKERHRKAYPSAERTPQIYIRGDKRDEAVQRLEAFVVEQSKKNASFIKIIHGRGLRSEGLPVLKPSVLAWLEGPGLAFIRGYIPERNDAGDYGSLIVELKQSDQVGPR